MKKIFLFGLLGMVAAFSSCRKSEVSSTTGWEYNNPDFGGFEKVADKGQATGPNLVFIPGGRFTMGVTEEDVMKDYNNRSRTVTVNSFYMDETEVSNIDYLEYLFWLNRVMGATPQIHRQALPDTLVWLEELSYNDPLVKFYLRHPAYSAYPVVGVSWLQAVEYCKWRSDRVNEGILIKEGKIELDAEGQQGENNFTTQGYLSGKYSAQPGPKPQTTPSGEERLVRFEDGVVLPDYLLPTEAMWEYAALALGGNAAYSKDERITDRRIYPWNHTTLRYAQHGSSQGRMLANFKRGRGDYGGISTTTSSTLNDGGIVTAPVRAFLPNDYGLYNMAGNVNEWVRDVYRKTTSSTLADVETQDMNPFRGNIFTEAELDGNGQPQFHGAPSSTQGTTEMIPLPGRIKYRELRQEDIANRRNFTNANVINYLDGDEQSESKYENKYSLVSDKSRVYKGGAWNDRSYWLAAGARRHLEEDKSSAYIGFRCSMIRVGSPRGNRFEGGNQFRKRKKKKRY